MKFCTKCQTSKPGKDFYANRKVCKKCLISDPVNIEPKIYKKHYRRLKKTQYFALVNRERSESYETIEEARKWRDDKLKSAVSSRGDLVALHKDNLICRAWV